MRVGGAPATCAAALAAASDTPSRVRAEPRLVRRPVELDECRVELALGGEGTADERVGEIAIHVSDRVQDAEAANPLAAVAKLGGLVGAGRAPRGDVGGA